MAKLLHNKIMNELRELLFEKGRVSKVLEALHHKLHSPEPSSKPYQALLYAHALSFYGDSQQALRFYYEISFSEHESEILWGIANANLRLGNLDQVESLIDEAFAKNPEGWLIPRIYNTLAGLYIYQGRFKEALSVIDKGIEASQRGGYLTEQLILEGNRGVVKIYQGEFEEAVFILQKTTNQLMVRDCILDAAVLLINLSGCFETLGAREKANECLNKAERFVQKSGSKRALIFLRQVQGQILEREGILGKAEKAYEESLGLLGEIPLLKLDVHISADLANLYFEKGNLNQALNLIRKTLIKVREKGLHSEEDMCLGYEGKFLMHSGEIEEGIMFLHQACKLAESLEKWDIYCYITLYLSFGYEELGERKKALEWLEKCFEITEHCKMLPALLSESEVLTSLLLRLGEELSPTEFLSRLIIHLRHPALIKRLLKNSINGKVNFLRSLDVHNALHFRTQLDRLRSDSVKEVRRACCLLLNNWQNHVSYRVYTFGSMKVFLEKKMFSDKDWIRPSVKRLFLYLLSHPEKWHTTESLLEILWNKPHPKRTRKVLNNLFSYLRRVFEPWHLPEMEYVFFQSQRGAYGFFPRNRFRIDYMEFLEGIKKAEKSFLVRNFKECRKYYREALDLYIGDYLEEFLYEDWLEQKRDYLRESYFRSVLRYAKLESDSGNLQEARRVLEEAMFKDLSRSGCATVLIQTLSRLKLSKEAKDWGQRHLNYVKKELRTEPTQEVLEAISRLN